MGLELAVNPTKWNFPLTGGAQVRGSGGSPQALTASYYARDYYANTNMHGSYIGRYELN